MKSLHEDDEISVDETFELNDRQSEDDGNFEDDGGSEDEMFSDKDLDKTGVNQGNAVVHKSITASVSAVSIYLVVSQ